MQNQPPGAQQEIFEHVVDLHIDLQIGRGISLEIAQHPVMVQQLIGSDLPIIELHVDQHGDEYHTERSGNRKEERSVGKRLVKAQDVVQPRQELGFDAKYEQQ